MSEDKRNEYLRRKSEELEMFLSSLRVVATPEHETYGSILQMNFREFSAQCVFDHIKEQELYISGKIKEDYIDLEQEKKLYKLMRERAEEVFYNFDEWYAFIKQDDKLPMFDSNGEMIVEEKE